MPTWWTLAGEPVKWLLGKGWAGFCVLLSLLGWLLCAWALSTLYEDSKQLSAENRKLSADSSRTLVECYQRPRYRQRPPAPATPDPTTEGTEDR